ncbi:MAG: HAD-IIA family hydrolase [Bacteroidales bacterium]|jgi:HAD superfamily hydrolase (TIGR01450 family)|nr:HAD-IIA family hydrolase [Bacteroidales bacterium]
MIDSKTKDRLSKIKHVALDMDGTIYNGSTLFPFTVGFLEKMKEIGIGYSFLTNNSSKSRQDYLLHLEKMGIPASIDEMYTSGQATIDYLQSHHPDIKRLFILGTPSLIGEFENAGFVSAKDDPSDVPDAVIVGFDTSLVYSRLCRAAWWIHQGLTYIATNPDKVCPTNLPVVLVDCCSMYTCLEKATGRMPDVVIGKPAPRMLDGIMYRYNLQPEEIAMVGDRIYTDIMMAKNTNALGVLVLTGETQEADVEKSDVYPDIVAKDLAEFGQLLMNSR